MEIARVDRHSEKARAPVSRSLSNIGSTGARALGRYCALVALALAATVARAQAADRGFTAPTAAELAASDRARALVVTTLAAAQGEFARGAAVPVAAAAGSALRFVGVADSNSAATQTTQLDEQLGATTDAQFAEEADDEELDEQLAAELAGKNDVAEELEDDLEDNSEPADEDNAVDAAANDQVAAGACAALTGPPSELLESGPRVAADEARLVAGDGLAAGSELWIVSTRKLSARGCCAADFDPCVERLVCGTGWVPATIDELLAADPAGLTTMVFVHGNDTSCTDAVTMGRQLFRNLTASRCGPVPVRLVIWSWPSDRLSCRVRQDAQIKACRTNVEGYYLSVFMNRLAGTTPVSLVGYSYGARVVTGALHVLGGGTLDGRTLETIDGERHPTHAVLVGAAMANDWLLPGRRHELALSQVERMVIVINPADGVLRFYPRLWGRGGPDALGATGLPGMGRLDPVDRAKVQHVNVEGELRRRHGWEYVGRSTMVMSVLRREATLVPAVQESHGAE